MIYGIIDVGSNSIRLSVYKIENDIVHNLFHQKLMAGLAGYKLENYLTRKGIEVLIESLEYHQNIVKNFEDIDRLFVFATASIRNVINCDDILEEVKERTGLQIDLISGEEEAYLSFIGASQSVDVYDGVLTDIGGGSTEVVVYKDRKILGAESLEFGSLSVFNDYVRGLLPVKDDRKHFEAVIDERLRRLPWSEEQHDVICSVGGSGRACLKLYNFLYEKPITNRIIEVDAIKKMIKQLEKMEKRDALKMLLKVSADRVHTLIPGMMILYRVASYFDSELVAVSTTGVREGYLYHKILGKESRRDHYGEV